MPIYEYRCRECKNKFEVIQKSWEGPEDVVCPACKEKNPEKLISSCCGPSSEKTETSSAAPSCGSHRFG